MNPNWYECFCAWINEFDFTLTDEEFLNYLIEYGNMVFENTPEFIW